MAAAASSLIRPLPFGAPVRAAAGWVAREPEAAGAGGWCAASRSSRRACSCWWTRDDVVTVLLTRARHLPGLRGREHDPAARLPRGGARRGAPRARSAAACSSPPARGGLLPAIAVIAVGRDVRGHRAARPPPRPPDGTCNGHAELCDRPLNEVALAVTHNSMSVPLPGWYASDAGGADRRPAPRRDPRPPDRHPLRRQAAERQGPHLLREHRGAEASGEARTG